VASNTSVASGIGIVAVVATSLGCMGGGGLGGLSSSSATSAATTSGAAALAARQGAPPAIGRMPESESAISQALWDNPVSRAVKNAFSGDVVPTGYTAQGGAAAAPVYPSTPAKPPTPELYIAMGQVAEQSGDKEKARAFYEKALSIGPNNANALAAFGRFEDRQGRLDAAASFYRQALQADPQHAGAHNDLGLCYARQGQYPQALELVRQAARLNPERPIYRNNVARVLVEMGRSQEALAELAAVFPPEEAHYNIGWFLTQSGRNDEAASHFAAALKYNPQMEQARAWLAKLQPSSLAAAPVQPPAGQNAPGQVFAAAGGVQAGQAAQQPMSQGTAAGGHMPIITSVRSAPGGAGEQPTSIASLPRSDEATTWPQSGPAAGGGATWSPAPQQAWPQSHASPYIGTAQDRYTVPTPQTPAAANQPAAHTGLEALMQAPAQTPRTAQPDGQSHESPWGTVPSPYQGSQRQESGWPAMQYPDSVSPRATAFTERTGVPETLVNPFVSGTAYGTYARSPVRQASAEVVQR
jgi:tetratricopeptide (TPR) repeat protein